MVIQIALVPMPSNSARAYRSRDTIRHRIIYPVYRRPFHLVTLGGNSPMGSEGDHLPFRISRGRDEEREEYKTSISLRVGRQSSVAEAGAFLHPRCGDVTRGGKWTGPPIPPARAFIGAPANTPDHKK